LAAEVVKADGNVRNLAWRICNAKKVLVSINQPAELGRWTKAKLVDDAGSLQHVKIQWHDNTTRGEQGMIPRGRFPIRATQPYIYDGRRRLELNDMRQSQVDFALDD
jgi:hypothetical protein